MIKENNKTAEYKLSVIRLTALWAFSEATLGGILHAFKIPFTGFFLGGTAVLLISLISKYGNHKSDILRSTIIVIIVKALISPHTPLTAYFAVFIQGFAGYLLFMNNKYYEVSAFILGIFALLSSALQKVIILTIIFGSTLWESLDDFAVYVLNQFRLNDITSFRLSWIIAGGYILLHILGGIFFGILAGRLPKWIEKRAGEDFEYDKSFSKDFEIKRRNKKAFWQKPITLLFIFFLIILLLISLDTERSGSGQFYKVAIMIIRSAAVMILWLFFVSPFLMKIFHRFIKNRMIKYSDEINEIIKIFPYFKRLLGASWRRSSELSGLKKLKYFFTQSFILLLLAGIEEQ